MSATQGAARAIAICRTSIRTHSKSFALASQLLPSACRDDAAVLYAWCRRADDAIDESPIEEQATQLLRLRAELDAVYGQQDVGDPVLAAFQELVRRCEIPRHYPDELLAGMAMDADGHSYADTESLMLYCYRVASTVGLMMSHVIGLSRDSAMRHAAQMGIAMQLTNVCRDVLEDWHRHRLYLPDSLLARHGAGALRSKLDDAFPETMLAPTAAAVEELLVLADHYYRCADRGLNALPWRAAFGVRTARLVYSDIGRQLRRAACDISSGRAVVSTGRKLFLVVRAGLGALAELPGRWGRYLATRARHVVPATRIEFSNDILSR